MKVPDTKTAATERHGEGMHHRREQSMPAAVNTLQSDPAVRQQILKERARQLAREVAPAKAPSESLEVVVFRLAHETYAIESQHISQIYLMREFVPVPSTPEFVLGLMNVRGQILCVIDIRKFFDLPTRGITDLNQVIVVCTQRLELGILADVIIGVRQISLNDLTPSLPTLSGIRAEYLRGVTREPIAVLDAARLLSDPRIIVDQVFEST